jgi:hexosaminidase
MRDTMAALILSAAGVTAVAAFAAPTRKPASAAGPGAALQLEWKFKEDVFRNPTDPGAARVAFTLTNGGARPLAPRGWAVYFSALHQPRTGTASGGMTIQNVTGELWRMVPGPEFEGLAPGQSLEIEYLSDLLTNISFAPAGPYIVFDDAPERGTPLRFTAVPFERPPQPAGRDPRVITPQEQFKRDAATRDLPLESLPPVFPTPVSIEKADGTLTLTALPEITAGAGLANEAALAAEYLRPYFAQRPAAKRAAPAAGAGAAALRLETGAVAGQASPEAYELVVDPATGIRIVGNSPAGVFYGLQSLRDLLPAPAAAGVSAARAAVRAQQISLSAVHVRDAPRFGYRGFMLDVARNFQPKASVLRVLDLLGRYKLNAFHFHLTDDEGWRVEIPSLPELTSVGSRRGHTLDSSRFLPPAYGSGPDVDRPYGSGHLSRGDYVEILKYAAACPRGDQGDGGALPRAGGEGRPRRGAALPSRRPRRHLRLHLGPGLPRQRAEPGAPGDLRVHRARRPGRRRDAPRGRRAAAPFAHGRR